MIDGLSNNDKTLEDVIGEGINPSNERRRFIIGSEALMFLSGAMMSMWHCM